MWVSAYLSKAFNLQVPTKVRVPRVHMLERKDTQPRYKWRSHRETSRSHFPVIILETKSRKGDLQIRAHPVQPGSAVSLLHPREDSDDSDEAQLHSAEYHETKVPFWTSSSLQPHLCTVFNSRLPSDYRFWAFLDSRPPFLPVHMVSFLTWASSAF